MDPISTSSCKLNLNSTSSYSTGLSFNRAFKAIEKYAPEELAEINSVPINIAYEASLGLLFAGAIITYLPTTGFGTLYGHTEFSDPPGVNDTFYPNRNVQIITGTIIYGAFLIAAIAIPIFTFYYTRSRPAFWLERGRNALQEQLNRLKQSLQQDPALKPLAEKKSLLPEAYVAEIFPLLTAADKKKLNFCQLKALRQHDMAAFKQELNAHHFAEHEEMCWNKIEALLLMPLKPSFGLREMTYEKNPLLQEGKEAGGNYALEQLQAALQNVSNFHYLRNGEVLEVLIHALPLEDEEQIVVKILAKHLATAHQCKASAHSWEQLVLTMHRHQCCWQMAERKIKRLSLLEHDIKFQCLDEKIVSANRSLLAESSFYFHTLLFGKMRGGQNADPNASFAMDLAVEAEAFQALVALLEGQAWQQMNCSSDTFCKLAILADYYAIPSLYPHIEEQCLAIMRTASDEVLGQLLASSQQCRFLQLDSHFDRFLALHHFSAEKFYAPLTKSFIHTLALVVNRKLPKCIARIVDHFLQSAPLVKAPSSQALYPLAELLLNLALHNKMAFGLLMKELYPWFSRAPVALEVLWDMACDKNVTTVLENIVYFCEQPCAHHIWLQSSKWSTPPTLPKTQLHEVL